MSIGSENIFFDEYYFAIVGRDAPARRGLWRPVDDYWMPRNAVGGVPYATPLVCGAHYPTEIFLTHPLKTCYNSVRRPS